MWNSYSTGQLLRACMKRRGLRLFAFKESPVLHCLHALTCVFRLQRTAQLHSTVYLSLHVACFTLSKSKGGKRAGREEAQPIQMQLTSTGSEPGQTMKYPRAGQFKECLGSSHLSGHSGPCRSFSTLNSNLGNFQLAERQK